MNPTSVKQIFCAGICAVALAACGGSGSVSEGNNESPKTSAKGKIIYSVLNKKVATRGNPARPEQGLGCSIGMKLANKTEREIRLVQILNYTAKTTQGDISGRGVNFRLDPKETTERAAIYVKGVSCEDVEIIQIEKIICNNASARALGLDHSCASDVIFQDGKNIKFNISDEAKKPLITVTP